MTGSILFYISDNVAIREAEPIIEALSTDPRWTIIAAADDEGVHAAMVTRFKGLPLQPVLISNRSAPVQTTSTQVGAAVKKRLLSIQATNKPGVLSDLAEAAAYFWIARRRIAFWNNFFRDNEVTRLFIFNDVAPYSEPLLIVAAKKIGVPVLLLPAINSPPQYPTRLRKEPRYRATGSDAPLRNRFFFRLFSEWTIADRERTIFKYNPMLYFVLHVLRGSSRHPWMIGCGRADLVLIDGDESRRLLDRHAHPRLLETGRPSLDKLHSDRRNKSEIRDCLADAYDLDSSKPWLLLALPQFAEHRVLEWESHWKEQHLLLQTLTATRFEVLVSLHPGMDARTYEEVLARYGLHPLKEDLSEVLVASDLFVSGYSTTTYWAVACGIPSVAFDFYDRGLTWLEGVPGTLTTTDKAEFASIIQSLQDVGERATLTAEAEKYGGLILDGGATERVLKAIQDVGQD